jgi:hypothetical protein
MNDVDSLLGGKGDAGDASGVDFSITNVRQ